MVVLSHNAPDLLVAVFRASPPTIVCFIIFIYFFLFHTISAGRGLILLQLNKLPYRRIHGSICTLHNGILSDLQIYYKNFIYLRIYFLF